ncbi:MAG: exodeoxyribonuclease subunit gamma, partial [Pseudomonadota bacterium]
AFIQFLQVCDSRFGWQSVLDLLSHPIIYPNFDLTETDLIYLKQWLTETEIRWGKSAAHKQQLGLPAFHENTWQHSIERLLMGYAIAEDQLFIDNILPYKNLEGSSTQALGGLIDFIELLFRASEELTIAQSLYSWQQKLTEYANLLFSTIEIEQRLSFIQQLTELTQSFVTELSNLIELSVIITVLNEYFNSGSKIHSLLRGSLTFSHLSTLQGVPFKVVAILGLNESEFPRLNKDSTIDLATNYRPKISQLDRLHFLQWIVNTEQQFILSYIGQSLAKQRKIPPSILLSELIEIVQYKIGIAYDDLVIYHPLQPFHSNYFNQENSALFSYSTYYAAIAIGFSQLNKPVIEPWWQGELAIEKPNLILLTDLLAFYRHPQRYFLKKQLDLSLKPLATPIEEREIFSLSGLSLYDLQHQWIEAKLSGNTFSLAQLVASGQWILGTVGELTFDIQQKKLADFVKIIEELAIGNALPQRLIDLSFQNYRLLGKLTHLYQQGSLFYRYSSLKGKDFFQALLHHLITNQLQSQTTYLLTKEQLIIFKPEIISTELFAELLDEYCQGQQRPDILFPEFVLAYIQQARQLINNPKIQKSAYAAAQQAWITQFNSDYEIELQQLYLGFESIAEQNREKWVQICEQWFLPLWLQLTIIPIESLV